MLYRLPTPHISTVVSLKSSALLPQSFIKTIRTILTKKLEKRKYNPLKHMYLSSHTYIYIVAYESSARKKRLIF